VRRAVVVIARGPRPRGGSPVFLVDGKWADQCTIWYITKCNFRRSLIFFLCITQVRELVRRGVFQRTVRSNVVVLSPRNHDAFDPRASETDSNSWRPRNSSRIRPWNDSTVTVQAHIGLDDQAAALAGWHFLRHVQFRTGRGIGRKPGGRSEVFQCLPDVSPAKKGATGRKTKKPFRGRAFVVSCH